MFIAGHGANVTSFSLHNNPVKEASFPPILFVNKETEAKEVLFNCPRSADSLQVKPQPRVISKAVIFMLRCPTRGRTGQSSRPEPWRASSEACGPGEFTF